MNLEPAFCLGNEKNTEKLHYSDLLWDLYRGWSQLTNQRLFESTYQLFVASEELFLVSIAFIKVGRHSDMIMVTIRVAKSWTINDILS